MGKMTSHRKASVSEILLEDTLIYELEIGYGATKEGEKTPSLI